MRLVASDAPCLRLTALCAIEGFSLETKAEWSMCPMRGPESQDFGLLGMLSGPNQIGD